MKALTVCQPYAHLIASSRKTCENRTWETKYRGPLYIHAGKSRNWLYPSANNTTHGIRVERMAFGAVVAIANLVDCVRAGSPRLQDLAEKMTEEQRGYIEGPWCWILAHVNPIGPWPWRGAQGLFKIDEDELARVANRELGITTDSITEK